MTIASVEGVTKKLKNLMIDRQTDCFLSLDKHSVYRQIISSLFNLHIFKEFKRHPLLYNCCNFFEFSNQ